MSSVNKLDTPIQYLKTVGPKRAESFNKIGIKTIGDLLYHFPTRYLDRSKILTTREAHNLVEEGFDRELTLIAKVYRSEKKHFNKKQILIVTFRDSDGFLECIWYQGIKYFEGRFKEGETYALSGKPTISRYGKLQLAHPDFDLITIDETTNFFSTGSIIPFYPLPKELKTTNIGEISLRKMIYAILKEYIDYVEEPLPQQLIDKHLLVTIKDALKQIHFPESQKQLSEAKHRFKYEEIFFLELLVALRKFSIKKKIKGHSLKPTGDLIREFVSSLPFELTESQKKVLREIAADLKKEEPTNRLLQGDVGSGKTIVALIAMLIAVDSGYQAALMAPTEILADQHLKNILNFIKNFNSAGNNRIIKVSLLLGSQKKSEREKELQNIETQEADIIVGTHALFEENVRFKNLGLVVIDEQHRFGVVQRAKLVSKGISPDVIVMSATPIPRTLTMTLYGDLDVSVIKEMPKDRIPIKTHLRGESKLPEIYNYILSEAKKGNQSFIVYPLVEESEKLDLKAAEEHYQELSSTFFKDVNVGLVHGKMKWQEKEAVMTQFSQKKFDILIATIVIEVGIDIPNATIMLINDAHRFGLSQLHQLRGRVGRGNKQSHCILVTKDEIAAASTRLTKPVELLSSIQLEKYKAAVRLQTMVQTNDGFKIAEVDMRLRGPGDIFGIKQSGYPDLKFIDLNSDIEIIQQAKEDAFKIISEDFSLNKPENISIRKKLITYYSDNLRYAKIG